MIYNDSGSSESYQKFIWIDKKKYYNNVIRNTKAGSLEIIASNIMTNKTGT